MSTLSVMIKLYHYRAVYAMLKCRERRLHHTNRKNSLLTSNFASQNIQNDSQIAMIGQCVCRYALKIAPKIANIKA